MRLAKEDSMVDDGPILTTDNHGDRFLCNRVHWVVAEHVLRYLRGTTDYGFWYKQVD